MLKNHVIVTAISIYSAVAPGLAQGSSPTAPSDSQLNQIKTELETKKPTEAALGKLQDMINRDPKSFRLHLMMGMALNKVGLPREAIEQYKLAVQFGPDSPHALMELVKAELTKGDADNALHMLTVARGRFPDDPEVATYAGQYFLMKNDTINAKKSFLRAQSAHKDIPGLSLGLAHIQMREHHYSQALELANAELVKDPTYPMALAVKGAALCDLHRYREAVAPLKVSYEAFGLMPGCARNYAEACFRAGSPRDALEPSLVAVAIGSSLFAQDQKAEDLLHNVISKSGRDYAREQLPVILDKVNRILKNPGMHHHLGDLFSQYGLRALATREYDLAVKENPNDFDACYKLAVNLELYYEQYDQAISLLLKAQALRPTDVVVADRLMRLRDRVAERQSDMAWQIKDLFRKLPSPI